jgi:DNA-binding FadR family transcriptional regulator
MREALRVMESEDLVAIRPGTRAGPVVHRPSVERATARIGVLLECAGTTIHDVWEARLLVEPSMMGLAARHVDDGTVAALREVVAGMGSTVGLSADFVRHSYRFRYGALGAVRNGALTVVFEIIRWISARSIDALSATAAASPWERRVNRSVLADYVELLAAFAGHDGERATESWRAHLTTHMAVYRPSMGDRFVVDLLE